MELPVDELNEIAQTVNDYVEEVARHVKQK